MNRLSTDFLAASGSLLIGMGSTFNLPGAYFSYNMAPSPHAADARALWQDFAMVGQDVTDILDSVSPEAIASNR
jgi:hypothetical protein